MPKVGYKLCNNHLFWDVSYMERDFINKHIEEAQIDLSCRINIINLTYHSK